MAKNVRRPRLDDDFALPNPPPLPRDASVGKRWRFRRNLVIYVAHRQGFSQRMLADVFDLPRSRIGEIINQLSMYDQGEARE